MRHRRLVNLRCAAHQKFDERWQSFRHLWRVIDISFLLLPLQSFLTNGQCSLHDAWHGFCLVTVAGTLDACHPFVLGFAVGGEDLGNPGGIIVAYMAEVASHGEDEIVSASVFGFSTHLLF